MVIVLLVLSLSLCAGWLAGGAVRNLAQLHLRRVRLLVVAVAAQLLLQAVAALGGPAGILGRPLLSVSHVALLAFLAFNRTLPGMPLVLLGFAANAAVILANGAMPVSPEALVAIGGATAIDPGKHQLLTEATRLPWLADVIALPVLRSVVSVGDLVLGLGVGVLVVAQMRRYPPRPGQRRRPRPVPPLSRRARAGAPRPGERQGGPS